MKNLLSSKTIRLLNIAEALIIQERVLSNLDISTINKCSLKTVNDDLIYLDTHWDHLLEMKFINSVVSTSCSSRFDFQVLKRNLYKQEIKIQLIIHLYLYPDLQMIDYAEMLNYSESHLRRQIKPINNYLERYDSQVEYNKLSYKYKLRSPNKLELAFLISQLIKKSLHQHLLTNFDTSKKEEYITFIKNESGFIHDNYNEDLELLYKVLIQGSEHKLIISNHFYLISDVYALAQNKKTIFQNDLTSYCKLHNIYIEKFEEETIIDILVLIFSKSRIFPHKIDNYWNRYNFFKQSLTLKKINSFNLYEEFSKFMCDKHNINQSYQDELNFLLYTSIQSVRHSTPYSIGVHSDLGHYHAKSLAYSCSKHFSSHNIEIYEDKKNYDLIVTTQNSMTGISEDKLVKVSDNLRLTDITKIHQFIYFDN